MKIIIVMRNFYARYPMVLSDKVRDLDQGMQLL